MKLLLTIALFLGIFIAIFLLGCDAPKSKKEVKVEKKVLRHVVLFKFKEGTSAIDIQKIEALFRNLPNEIREIKDFEWGLNNSPENLNQGFTHCFFLSFVSEADRDIYLPHPAHKEFGEALTPFLDKVLVLDYWAQ